MLNRDEIDPQGAVIRQTAEAAVAISEELTDLNPNIEIDAKEFGEHVRNGGWRLGLLVARSVEKSAGHGIQLTGPTAPKDAEYSASLKISGRAFARQAGRISDKTVSKYLDSWNMAAADGLVPSSSDLSPGQGYDFDEEVHTSAEWKKYFAPPSGDEKNAMVSLYNKITGMSVTDLEVINEANFSGQTDFTIPQGYQAFCNLERVVQQGKAGFIALARALNVEVRSDGEED